MKGTVTETFESLYLPIVIVFLFLVFLERMNIISLPINYQLFILILPILAIPTLLRSSPYDEKSVRFVLFLVLTFFLFAFCIRLLPLTRSSIPLGYDPGFYKYTMELYFNSLPAIPEAGLATWVKQMSEQGLFVLSDAMHILAGTDAIAHINYLFPFIGAFLVLPVFIVTRNLFGQRGGIIAAALYAVSYTQYEAFSMLYFKTALGLMFLLMSIYALEKGKYWLMALMFAALGIFHRPEFLLFALVLVPYFLLYRKRGIILAMLGTVLLVAPFWLPRWGVNWAILSDALGTAVTNVPTGAGSGGGTFFGLETYTVVSLAYLPFAVIGAIYLVLKKSWNSILFYFLINAATVVFQLIFFKRFIIPLDIAVVILAAVGICYTLLSNNKIQKIMGVCTCAMILGVTVFPTLQESIDVRPLINEDQLAAVNWISENAEEDAYVLATSYDAPWVLGWSGRRVIAPGLFEWNIHDKNEWVDFFHTESPEEARGFLDKYDSPIYIYYSKNFGNYLGLDKFQGDVFRKVYDNGAVVYRYPGGD